VRKSVKMEIGAKRAELVGFLDSPDANVNA
jgi:hypothetical protein